MFDTKNKTFQILFQEKLLHIKYFNNLEKFVVKIIFSELVLLCGFFKYEIISA